MNESTYVDSIDILKNVDKKIEENSNSMHSSLDDHLDVVATLEPDLPKPLTVKVVPQ